VSVIRGSTVVLRQLNPKLATRPSAGERGEEAQSFKRRGGVKGCLIIFQTKVK
jgi:hypothetical protein